MVRKNLKLIREFKFSSKNYERYIKMLQNNVVSKATSIFLYYVPDFFNKSLINTFLFVSYSRLRCLKNRREIRTQINRTTTVANVTEA